MDAFPVRCVLLRATLVLGICFLPAGTVPADDQNQDGRHGHGHAQWHDGFYQKLMVPGTKTSCCNLADCRPTQIRAHGDHYEIMKDGRWIRVDPSKIVKTLAPDGGAHICAPETYGARFDPDYVFCIIMPLET